MLCLELYRAITSLPEERRYKHEVIYDEDSRRLIIEIFNLGDYLTYVYEDAKEVNYVHITKTRTHTGEKIMEIITPYNTIKNHLLQFLFPKPEDISRNMQTVLQAHQTLKKSGKKLPSVLIIN